MGRATAAAVLLSFFGSTAGSGALDLARPAPLPRLTGQELREDEALRREARILDGSRMAVIDRDLSMRSNLNHHVVPWYTAVMIRVFREGTAGVLVGRDEWLFSESRLAPGATDEARLVVRGANVLAAVARNLAQCGTRVVILPIPRKSVVAAPFVPPGRDPHAELDHRLLAALSERGVPTADLFTAWEGLEPGDLYYRWDTHWTRRAQLLAAEAVCTEAGLWVRPEERRTSLEAQAKMKPREGQLLMMGLGREHPATQLFFPLEPVPRLRLLDQNRKRISPHEVPSSGGEWVAFGTSFTAGDQLAHYLSHCADGSFQNQGAAGEAPMSRLAELLIEKRPDDWPELVVLEYPMYHVFMERLMLAEHVVRLLTEVTPRRRSLLLPDERFERAPPRTGPQVFTLPARALATRGDGVAALQLTGRPGGRRPRVSLDYGGLRQECAWPDESPLVIPLVADREGGGDLVVSVRGADVERLELVAYHDLASGLELVAGEAAREAGVWTRDLLLPRPATPTRSAALACRIDVDAAVAENAAVDLELLPAAADGPTHPLGRYPVAAGTWLLVTLGDRPAGAWRGVRLRTEARGAALARIEASLVELHEPGR